MKKFSFWLFIIMIMCSLNAFAQEDFDPNAPLIDEDELSTEEGSFQSELAPPVSDEVANPGEIERQEDILYPEGEENWSLGSEDIPSEEFEN